MEDQDTEGNAELLPVSGDVKTGGLKGIKPKTKSKPKPKPYTPAEDREEINDIRKYYKPPKDQAWTVKNGNKRLL